MTGSPVSNARVGSNPPVTSSTPVQPDTPTLGVAPAVAGPTRAGNNHDDDDDDFELLHGLHENQTSTDYLEELNSNFMMYFTEKRHETVGQPKDPEGAYPNHDWRMRDRLKTVSAALALCLNIGVDPPDVVRTAPCAKLECWIDTTGSQNKLMEQIGKKLQEQYETFYSRTRYKQYLDPSLEETKKACMSLRRNAKEERVLFHYNGHGVPLPSATGEIWVFNKTYTQYIPVSLYVLQSWLGGPSLFVFDVSHGGNIVHNFHTYIEQHKRENAEIKLQDPNANVQNYDDCILLAASERNELLPSNPDLPADLFTCCLTTPIEIALRFFILHNPLDLKISLDDFVVPGRLTDRRTPLGEVFWIFTAITDTIAWITLPRPLFKKLFRQDLMVAALFRNFLLAERIMRAHQCHPVSSPALPETHTHPLWQSWDLAVESVLRQIPSLMNAAQNNIPYEYQPSSFFTEQLTAFRVYLMSGPTEKNPPEQLPVLLQVLLSQAHRLRALVLLSEFLDLGPWAVNLALSIGIFPYVNKLLQSAAVELKPVLIFIWARIMAIDSAVKSELLKDNGIHYFVNVFNPAAPVYVHDVGEHRAMCAFIIALFCSDFPQGQTVCLKDELFDACLTHLRDPESPLLRQWSALCLSMLWANHTEAKWFGLRRSAPLSLCKSASTNSVPEVRTAIVHALTNFLGIPDLTDEVALIEENIAIAVLPLGSDGSVLVRKEVLIFFSTFIKRYLNKFLVAAYEHLLEERYALRNRVHFSETLDLNDSVRPHRISKMGTSPDSATLPQSQASDAPHSVSANTTFGTIWKLMLILSADPHPVVSQDGSIVVDFVHKTLFSESPLASAANAVRDELIQLDIKLQGLSLDSTSENDRRGWPDPSPLSNQNPAAPDGVGAAPGQSKESNSQRLEGYLQSSLRRTASVAASLKNLAFGSSNGSPKSNAPNAAHNPSNSNGTLNRTRSSLNLRSKLPPEWSRPPGVTDQSSKGYYQSPKPYSPGFVHRDFSVQPVIPLKSTFLRWSTEYFRGPQMRAPEPYEPGSADWNERLWRQGRNERIMLETQPLKEKAGKASWNTTRALLNNPTQPVKMRFHQFEDHLAVADDRDNITVWDWARNSRLARFSNSNPAGSRMSDLCFINEDDRALLMTGSTDGVLKIFRNYEIEDKTELVTAFRVLPELVPSNKNAGLIFDWMQVTGKAYVAGDIKVIRVFNASKEICEAEIPARSGSCITALTAEQVAGSYIVAGFGDGAIRVFDPRMSQVNSLVKVWREHKQWITNVHMQRGGIRELVSASHNGEVKLWDIRNNKSLTTVQTTKDSIRAMSVHEHIPVFAIGTNKREVKSFNTDGTLLSNFEPHSSFLQQTRSSPIVDATFHPHQTVLACSAHNDLHINLVSCSL